MSAQPKQSKYSDIVSDGGLDPRNKFDAQPEQELVNWLTLQLEAQAIVEGKYLFKRFIDGTPLANDIAVWMTEFALKYATPHSAKGSADSAETFGKPEQKNYLYEYAKNLAVFIWTKHYKKESPDWKPLPDVLGVLTQIDNMTCGLEKAQPEQEEPLPLVDIGVDVTPEGTHVVACYNRPDAVQEMFYSQFHPLVKPEQEPKLSDAGVDTNIPLWGLEPKGKGMLTFHQPNLEHQPWCDYLNIMLTSMPPQRANCNCKTAQPEPKSISTNDHLCAMLRQVHDVLACTALPMKRPWVGLTDEEIKDIWISTWKVTEATDAFAYAIEAKLKEKNT